MMYKHRHVPPLALSELNKNVPQHVERAILKALAKRREDRYPEVEAFIEALLSVSSSNKTRQHITHTRNEERWLKKGNRYYRDRDYHAALEAYTLALQINPRRTTAYNNKGFALYKLKRYSAAFNSFKQAIKLNPSFAAAYCGKGNVLLALGRHHEALAAFDWALRLDARYKYAYVGRGTTMLILRRYREALAAFEQAIEIDPLFAAAYHHRGLAYERMNMLAKAQVSYALAKDLGYQD